MDKIFSRLMYVLGFIVVVVFASNWFVGGENNSPELPSSLSKVQCLPKPNNDSHAKNNRALLKYDTYSIYQICIPVEMMPYKGKLKCSFDDYEEKEVCDEQAILMQSFVHAGISDIYATNKANTKTPDPKSEVVINFSQQSLPIAKPRNQYYTTEEYIKQGIVVPSKLRLRGDPVCQSPLSGKPQGQTGVVRDASKCFVNVAFGVLNINLEINVLADSNKRLKRSQQIDEVNFWLRFVNSLVINN